MKEYLRELEAEGDGDPAVLAELAGAAGRAGNSGLYLYLSLITGRDSIIENIRAHMRGVLGDALTDQIFSGIVRPGVFEPPERAWAFAGELAGRLEAAVDAGTAKEALKANAHGIPAGVFAPEAERFRSAGSLQSYLEDSHRRAVRILQQHADSGQIWFEQRITQPVVDYVASNQEILGGVLRDGRICWTKIPYDPDAWLKECDPARRRYLACHCPLARGSLNQPGGKVPGIWCNCTAGFLKTRFDAVFGRGVEVELLESVLGGSDRCRFAIHPPPIQMR